MNPRNFPLVLLLAFPLFSHQLRSQPHDLQFERISTSQGLSSAWVWAIHQDTIGFLWIGTLEGLDRYNGHSITSFKENPNDSTFLRKDVISSLAEDKDGNLWIGTWSGLHQYDRTRMQFRRYPRLNETGEIPAENRIIAMARDEVGRFWVATEAGGISAFDPMRKLFVSFLSHQQGENSLSHDSVRALAITRDGAVWIATARAVDVLTPDGHFSHFRPDARKPETRLFENVNAILEGKDGSVWLGTRGYGLVRLDRRTGGFTRHTSTAFKPDRESSIWITCLWEDEEGCIWIGTIAEGLMIFDPKTETFHQYQYERQNPKSLISRHVLAVTQDRSGNIWIGTADGGVSKCNVKKRKFNHYMFEFDGPDDQNYNDILSIHEDGKGNLWLGTMGATTDPGLIRFNRRIGDYRRIHAKREDLVSVIPNVFSIQEDSGGNLWLATYGEGLFRLNPLTLRFDGFYNKERDRGLQEKFIRTLSPGRSGILWVGTRGGGIFRFDPVRKTFDRILPATPELNRIVTMHEVDEEHLLVGTGQYGLLYINHVRSETVQYTNRVDDTTTLSSDVVMVIHKNQSGQYWIGTSEGLNRFDPATGKFRQYTEWNGFPGSEVRGILEDREGILWIATETKILRFDDTLPDGKKFRVFNQGDGIQSGEFNRGAYYQSRQGEMFFGGREGLNSFFPEQVVNNPHVPPVVFLSVTKLNTTFPVEKVVERDGGLVLKPSENVVTFEFSALEFTDPTSNQYACMMEGFDDDWRNLGSERRTTYTNLNPGEYVFRVKASNNDGVWNHEGVALRLTVIPPYWKTWWFRSLLAAVLLGGVSFLVWRRRQSVVLRLHAQEHFSKQLIESQERERKRIAAELHDSLGQNIMIMKNRALLGLRDGEDRENLRGHLEQISEVATQTLEEARRISYNLRPYQLDRFGLTEAVRFMLEEVSKASTIECSGNIDNIDGMLPRDLEINVYRIVQEGMNNVVKHSGAARCTVNIRKTLQQIIIRIADDGEGLKGRQETSERPANKGFGLAGMQERVWMLGGTIQLRPRRKGGTVVSIMIPIRGGVNG